MQDLLSAPDTDPELILAYLNSLLTEIDTAYFGINKKPEDNKITKFIGFKLFVESNLTDHLSVSQIANELAVSSDSLYQIIKHYSGLVGSRLLPRLSEAGFECVAFVRGNQEVPSGVTALTGDLLDIDTLANAVKGVAAVVHLAAVFRTRDMDLIWKSNFEGTRNLIAAVKAHSPDARFIMASTAHVYPANRPYPWARA